MNLDDLRNDITVKQKKGLPIAAEELFWKDAVAKLYSTGGLVDYTGLAMVHGSKSKPESFLNSD